MPNISKEIAVESIYHYLEDELNMFITTSRRRIMAKQATKEDTELLELNKYDFVLVTSSQVFNSKGIMFEYTESRHHPNKVCFFESATRNKG